MSLRNMKPVATKSVRISSLTMPGEWKAILKSDQAAQIAKSLERYPILQRPGIRKADRSIIWGRHRIAALHQAGKPSVLVDIWDVTAEEAAEMKDVENAVRRNADLDAQKRLLDRWSQQLDEARRTEQLGDPIAKIEPPRRGRPKTERGKLREEMAAMRGVDPKTVARQDQAAAKAEEPPPGWGDEGVTVPDGPKYPWLAKLGAFETWGLDHLMTEGFCQRIVETRKAAGDVVNRLDSVLASITHQEGHVLPAVFADLDLQSVYSRVQQIASGLRALHPVAVCPYCKGVPLLLRHCKGCQGLATVGKEALERAPKELRVGGKEAGVYVRPNEFRRLSELEAA